MRGYGKPALRTSAQAKNVAMRGTDSSAAHEGRSQPIPRDYLLDGRWRLRSGGPFGRSPFPVWAVGCIKLRKSFSKRGNRSVGVEVPRDSNSRKKAERTIIEDAVYFSTMRSTRKRDLRCTARGEPRKFPHRRRGCAWKQMTMPFNWICGRLKMETSKSVSRRFHEYSQSECGIAGYLPLSRTNPHKNAFPCATFNGIQAASLWPKDSIWNIYPRQMKIIICAYAGPPPTPTKSILMWHC